METIQTKTKPKNTNKFLSSHADYYNVDEAIALLNKSDHFFSDLFYPIFDDDEDFDLKLRHFKTSEIFDVAHEDFVSRADNVDVVEAIEAYEEEMRAKNKDPLDYENWGEWKGCRKFGYMPHTAEDEEYFDDWKYDFEIVKQHELMYNSIVEIPHLFEHLEGVNLPEMYDYTWTGFHKKAFDKLVKFVATYNPLLD